MVFEKKKKKKRKKERKEKKRNYYKNRIHSSTMNITTQYLCSIYFYFVSIEERIRLEA